VVLDRQARRAELIKLHRRNLVASHGIPKGMPTLARWPLVLILLAIFASTLPAQKKNQKNVLRDVQGVVSDESGKPVVGAVVQLKNTKNLEIISFITRDQGDYYFHGLSPDIDFEITAEFGGKMSAVRTLSAFDSRKQAVMNLKLDKVKKT
jgi:hypothetical protein